MTRQAEEIARRSETLGRRRGATTTVLDRLLATHGLTHIPRHQLAPNPRNVRRDMGDLPALAATFRTLGIVDPLIVCTVEAWRAAADDAEVFADDVTHVVLEGNRRLAAAAIDDIPSMPTIVRDDLAGAEEYSLQVISSLHRKGLTPIEEAEALTQMPGTQQEVASLVGIDQASISRKRKLLRLPDDIKKAVHEGLVSPRACEHILKLPDQTSMLRAFALMTRDDDARLSADAAAEVVRHEIERDKAADVSRRWLADHGVTVIDPVLQWPVAEAALRLVGHDDLTREQKRGHGTACLVAAISADDGLIDWYCAALDRHGVLDDEVESKQARKARQEKLRDLAAAWPGASAAAYELAESLIAAAGPGRDTRMAIAWAAELGIVPPETADRDIEDALSWVRRRVAGDARVRFARLLDIARAEVALRATGEWGQRQRAAIGRLVDDVGYKPTAWEVDRLNRIDEAGVSAS